MGTFPGTSGHTRSLQSAYKPTDIENRRSCTGTYNPSDQLPPLVFEAEFLKTGHWNRQDIAGVCSMDPYGWFKTGVGRKNIPSGNDSKFLLDLEISTQFHYTFQH